MSKLVRRKFLEQGLVFCPGNSLDQLELYKLVPKDVTPAKAGVQNPVKRLDVLARYCSLRLPLVALLEFIPMKIGAGMTDLGKIASKINQRISETRH